MNERQRNIYVRYAEYRDAGDDDMNARLRVVDPPEGAGIFDATREELDIAQALYGDADDIEDEFDTCEHDWQEQPGEPPVDVCSSCGAVRS